MYTRRAFLALGLSAVVASLAACAPASPATGSQSASASTSGPTAAAGSTPAAAAPLPTTALLIATTEPTAAAIQPSAAPVEKPKSAVTAVKPLFIDFFAPWWGACQQMMPVVHRLEEEYSDRVEFQSLNIDEPATLDAQQKYRFIGQPQFVIVRANGEVFASRNGVFSYEQLKGDIEKALAESK